MKLEDIGFYTLSNERAQKLHRESDLARCELIVTDRCNFRCSYCRALREDCRGDISTTRGIDIIDSWAEYGLKNIRFSGGEPLLHADLGYFVERARSKGIWRVAVSTNGSFPTHAYLELLEAGVNDFSISLDACCSAFGDSISGVSGAFDRVVHNIKELSKLTYVSVGVVITQQNIAEVKKIVEYAHDLGVSDIRVIPAAQDGEFGAYIDGLDSKILQDHPILKYRLDRAREGKRIRGLDESDSDRCSLVIDDMAVAGGYHFPCIIYLREGGEPIGEVFRHWNKADLLYLRTNTDWERVREERYQWSLNHNTHNDPICKANCLDVCVAHNNLCQKGCLVC